MHERVLHLQIRGRVQGVGYRASMAAEARRLGVCGWVRNRRDGSVEAMLAGSDDAVRRLLAWSHHGPPAAEVDRVHAVEGKGRFDAFEQRPTA
jgi:acylphosphatase